MIGSIKSGLKKIKNFVKNHLPSFIAGAVVGGVLVYHYWPKREIRIESGRIGEQLASNVVQDAIYAVEKLGSKASIDEALDALYWVATDPFGCEENPNKLKIAQLLNT